MTNDQNKALKLSKFGHWDLVIGHYGIISSHYPPPRS